MRLKIKWNWKDFIMTNLLGSLRETSWKSPTKAKIFQHSVVPIPSFYFEITEKFKR